MLLVLLWCALLCSLVYFYLKQATSYWKRRNVPHRKPNLLFGNLTEAILLKKNLGQIYTDIYNEFPEFPYVGIYIRREPALIIRDPELVQKTKIKDFGYFEDNAFKIDEEADPIAAKNPIFQSGAVWRVTRSQLSQCFTTGKLKPIIPLMVRVGDDMVKFLDDNRKAGNISFESKELMTRFTTDNVASCAFGLEAKSFVDKEAHFRNVVKLIFNPTIFDGIRVLTVMLFPSLALLVKAKFIPAQADKFFRNIVSSTLEYRLKHNVTRNDFLDVMNEMRNNSVLNHNIDDILGHCLSFLSDGTETSALALSFTLYELAVNTSCQEKAREEIVNVLKKHQGKVTYEALSELTYTDCCIYESLRMHPPAHDLMKLCTKAYEFEPINGNKEKLRIEAGTTIIFPIIGLHMDEKYFPEPHVFKPERFSEENKASIVKGSYFPFGNGPRVCIGQRFAMLQLKVAIVALLTNFDIKLNERMKTPLEYTPKYFMLSAKDGLWLDYHRRSCET